MIGCALPAVVLAVVAAAPVSAEPLPPPPPLHHVQYTVTTDAPFFVHIYYREADPPTWSDYSHNPYEFSPRADVDVAPDRPWVFDAMLADPELWAMVTVQSGESPNLAPPTMKCTLAVDGVVVKTNSGPKGALCSLRSW
ncbi:hypothetical protein [Mycobacterium sp. C31M]